MNHIVIIGNGIGGISTALSFRKKESQAKITIISKESSHFFSRPALMYVFMGHMSFKQTQPYEESFWKEQNITLLQDTVSTIDFENKQLKLQKTNSLSYDSLVLATGSASNYFGWPGQDLKGVQGFYSFQDLELLEENYRNVKRAVIIGGGLIGVEVAEMLQSRNIPVTFLVREKAFWDIVLPEDEANMISRHIREHHIDLRLETELKEIVSDSSGRVSKIITSTDETIECEFVGITVGVHPNIDFLKESGLESNRGILIDNSFRTNKNNVYAIGDCAEFRTPQPGRRPVEQVWYTAKTHGETLGKILGGESIQYQPGIWYNSAKFFDIEYQTYGMILPILPEGEKTFYWEDSSDNRSVRINYKESTNEVTGFNFFGIRARHEICEKWLAEKREVSYVIEHIGALNFDPEFFNRFEDAVVNHFNLENTPVTLKTKKGLYSEFWSRIWNSKKEAV